MTTKKAIAVILAVVMLVMPLAVSSIAAESATIISNPVKTAYTDAEYFNPQGLTLLVGDNEIVYSPADTRFRFSPAINEFLTVDTTEVAVYFNNAYVGTVTIKVDHILGELTAISNGHGYYCLGCGSLHNFENHTVAEWIPNDDGGLLMQQTQTGKCTVCDASVTEKIPNSENFLYIFGEMTTLEGTVILYIYTYLVSLIQAIAGVS